MTPWITVVGVGDNGLEGITPAARRLVESAELLVGGERHQAMVPTARAERLTWAGGLETAMDAIERWRGRRVVVLATGDPMCFGAGANLRRRFAAEEMQVMPVPGAFSLAAARMLWSLPDCDALTVHGRPLETLHAAVQPGARLLVLSRDGETPAQVAYLLTNRGFGPSRITVLEHLGGPAERRVDGSAETWDRPHCADLNTLAIECLPGPDAQLFPPVPGLPDEAFEHDGKITKREARAAAVAALAPQLGQVLWDIGAGSGAVAIEWLRAVPRRRADALGRGEAVALAVERDGDRCTVIGRNAAALGVPHLRVVEGPAPSVLSGLEPAPDAVFIGGGLRDRGVVDTAWAALSGGGRLVAHAVTLEGQSALFEAHAHWGGTLTRLAVSRAEPVGRLTAFRPLMEVTQYVAVKR